MSLNDKLLAPNFKIETRRKNGSFVKRNTENCYYNGHLVGDPSSLGAVSACKGLVCIITVHGTDKYFFFVVLAFSKLNRWINLQVFCSKLLVSIQRERC